MGVTHFAIKRPMVVIMAFLAVILLGVMAYSRLPVGLYPKVNMPYVSIDTSYPGADPDDVETFVTKPVEDAVAGISGLKNITSTSAEGMSNVVLEFQTYTDASTAATDTERALATIKATLPADAKDPVVVKYDVSGPVLYATFSGPVLPAQLYDYANQTIKPALLTVPGVSQVQLVGGQQREVQVQFDPIKLEAYNLSVNQLSAALAAENINVPAGPLDQSGKESSARLMVFTRRRRSCLTWPWRCCRAARSTCETSKGTRLSQGRLYGRVQSGVNLMLRAG
jgi:HAE1 family hydrophobic/amphiphilic exporter-1